MNHFKVIVQHAGALLTCIMGMALQINAQCTPWQLYPDNLYIPCGTTCTRATAPLPQFKSTTHYRVQEISYNPLLFNGNPATELTQLYTADNRYSTVQNIGFPVSFYGASYNSFVVGNNGVVSFDVSLAGCPQSAVLTNGAQPQTLPYGGGQPCGPVTQPHYPGPAIFVYQNLDAGAPGPPGKRIEWRTEGAAPCRRLVISFNEIPLEGSVCNRLTSSFQIILYEHSGEIDILLKNKATCANTTGNLAILGLQNATQTAAVTAPGKNATLWAEALTAYRFIPDGTAGLFQSAILEKNGLTQAIASITGQNSQGELLTEFSPYCFTAAADTLLLTARYATATGNGVFTLTDTIFLNKNIQAFSFTTQSTTAVCTNANGSITVQLPPLADPSQYVYAINQGALQPNPVFSNLTPGSYLVKVSDLSGVCQARQTILVSDTNPLTATYNITNATCTGLANGSVLAQAANGTPPYRYSFDNGGLTANNFFTGLAPFTYPVTVVDAMGCTRQDDVTVRPGTAVNFTQSVTAAYCDNTPSGGITIQPVSGTPPFQFSINGGPFQNSPIFNQLMPVPHTITVKDAAGCTFTAAVDVPAGPGISVSATSSNASCYTAPNGSITVFASGGRAPYLYAVGNGPLQPSNVFQFLTPGIYTITVIDDLGCTKTIEQPVFTNSATILDLVMNPPFCSSTSDGSINVVVSGGVPPYQFKLNNGPWQSSNVFSGLPPAYYIITVMDAAGCINAIAKELLPGEPFDFFPTATDYTCHNDTSVIIVPTVIGNGVPPYQYAFSTDGNPVYQNSNSDTVKASQGAWLVYVKDSRGCVVIRSVTIQQINTIQFSANTIAATCAGGIDGRLEVISNNDGHYMFSIGGPAAYQASNIFTGLAGQQYTLHVKDSFCTRFMDVFIGEGPRINISSNVQPASCPGIANGMITLTPVWAHPPVQYSLGLQGFSTNNVFSGLAAGNYVILVRDSIGCFDTLQRQVTATPLFDFNTVVIPATCTESNDGSIAIQPAAAGAYTYSINNSPWQTDSVFTSLFPGTYRVAARSAGGCIRTRNILVTAGSGITATAGITQPITCTQSTGIITISVTNGRPPLLFSINNGPYVTNNQFTGLPAGNYVFRVKDASNCTALVTATLDIPPEPLLSLNITRPCNGQNGLIQAITAGGTAPFAYSVNGGAFQPSPSLSLAAGNYTIVVKDALECVSSRQVQFIQYPPVTLSAQVQHAGCTSGQEGRVLLQPQGEGTAYTYSINGGPFAADNPLLLPAGTYNIAARDEFGCTSAYLPVTLGVKNGIQLAPPPDTILCEGAPVTLTTASNAAQFNWQPPLYLNDNQLQNPVITPFTPQLYTVTATMGGCQVTRFVNVGVKPAPFADAGRDTMVCFGEPRTLQGSGGVQYRWRPATGLSNANTANPVFTGNQTSTYYLTVVGANGCASLKEDTVIITRLQPVPAFAGKDTAVLAAVPYQLQAAGGISYVWSPPDFLNNAFIANPLSTLTQDQRYVVTVTDTNGCRGTDDIVLKIYRPLIFPSAFSPNGDGVNDVFTEASGNSLSNYSMKVYNRWGQLIFETTMPGQGWNGRYKNADQPGGTYVYIAEAFDGYLKKTVRLKGTVILVR